MNSNNKLETTLIATINNYKRMIEEPDCSEMEKGILQKFQSSKNNLLLFYF